jgi:hypothetical protein
MKAREAFGVVIRSVGLLLVLAAIWSLFFAALNVVGGGPGNTGAMIITGVPTLVVGLWLLRGAPALVRFAFPAGPQAASDGVA